MLLLGFRLDNDLKLEFENNFENDLLFVENIMSFMEAIKSRKYEAIVIDERNSKEDALINLIIKVTELQKKAVIIILGETSNGGFSPTADPDGEEVVDRVLQNVTYSNGLVSGSKMGNSEGGLLTDWSDSNRAPEFPKSARDSGKHGKLKIKLKVDKAGNVLSYVIVEGSGVPEIDASVERVVGSWKVKLLKKGKPVNGTFYLNYNFNFK